MTPEITRLLTDHQRAVTARVIAGEAAHRAHVVVSLSGAHAYGFPSPDSDLDIKCVHADPTRSLLGFPRTPRAAERLEVIDGVEIDYSSNELGAALRGVLKGNGNFIERFLSGYAIEGSATLESLKPLVQRALCRRVYRHYGGFAAQQRLEWEKTDRRSVKKLLYVLRTTLTGAHLLRTGETVTDLTRLLAKYELADALELVTWKTRGERSELPEALVEVWARRVPDVFTLLHRAFAQSVLPEEPPNADELEAWLVERRLEASSQGRTTAPTNEGP